MVTGRNFTFGYINALVDFSGTPILSSYGTDDMNNPANAGEGVGGKGTNNDWVATANLATPTPVLDLGRPSAVAQTTLSCRVIGRTPRMLSESPPRHGLSDIAVGQAIVFGGVPSSSTLRHTGAGALAVEQSRRSRLTYADDQTQIRSQGGAGRGGDLAPRDCFLLGFACGSNAAASLNRSVRQSARSQSPCIAHRRRSHHGGHPREVPFQSTQIPNIPCNYVCLRCGWRTC